MKTYVELLNEAFPGIQTSIQRCEKVGYGWPSKPFLKENQGKVISHVGFLDYPILIEGKLHAIGAFHAVCTQADFRGKGFASQLLQDALAWAKDRYECILLFTSIPAFYERLGFKTLQEHRFHLTLQHAKGSQLLLQATSPEHDARLLRTLQKRAPLSNTVWMRDLGTIIPFNTLFATYPDYWSLNFCPALDCFISFVLENKTLHLFDVIAEKLPSLDQILEHLPDAIDEIYFYFSPDLFTHNATVEPHVYDNGYLQVHGQWPGTKPFMIQPLSRC